MYVVGEEAKKREDATESSPLSVQTWSEYFDYIGILEDYLYLRRLVILIILITNTTPYGVLCAFIY